MELSTKHLEKEVLAETGHAFGLTRADGVQVLVHIGIDTVEMQGSGFVNLVKMGEKVKVGQPIVKVDTELLRSKGYDLTTMLIIADANGKKFHSKNMAQ